MAYVTICTPCLDEKHEDCLEAAWNRPADAALDWLGAAICVCGHATPSRFEESVRANLREDNVQS